MKPALCQYHQMMEDAGGQGDHRMQHHYQHSPHNHHLVCSVHGAAEPAAHQPLVDNIVQHATNCPYHPAAHTAQHTTSAAAAAGSYSLLGGSGHTFNGHTHDSSAPSNQRAMSPRDHLLSPRHDPHLYMSNTSHGPLPTEHLPHCYHANCCQGLLTACDMYGVACQHTLDDDSSESPRTQDSGFEGLSSRHDVTSVQQVTNPMYDQWPASNRQSTGSGGPVYRRLPPQTNIVQAYDTVCGGQPHQHSVHHHQMAAGDHPHPHQLRTDSQSSSSDLALAQLDDIGFADADGEEEPAITEVIDLLAHPRNSVKVNAAAYLQHLSYMNDDAKSQIRALGGIPLLVSLLSHEQQEVQKAACGALRNLSCGRVNDTNKREIKSANGISALITLLQRSQIDGEIQEMVTGILWNLSSCQDLKRAIIDVCVPVLVQKILLLHSDWKGAGQSRNIRPELVFSNVMKNTSGILRNVSSDGLYARKRLRHLEGVVDSCMAVVEASFGRQEVNSKTVENVTCLLRNLSFDCEEVQEPAYFSRGGGPTLPNGQSHKEASASCFGVKTPSKKDQHALTPENMRNMLSDNTGAALLWHSSIIHVYLRLIKECNNPDTLEAAAGALQNLAACEWKPSIEVRATVRKEKGLPLLVELLSLDADHVICTAATALRNLAIDQRNKELIGKYSMKQLVSKLPDNGRFDRLPTDDTLCAIQTAIYEVIRKNVDFAQLLVSEGGVRRLMFIIDLKGRFSPKVTRLAALLLHSLWHFKELHAEYKKMGLTENDFVSRMAIAPTSSSKSAPNTLTRPHMDQSVNMYSQRTPQPLARGPINYTLYGEDSNSSLMSSAFGTSGGARNTPMPEEIAMSHLQLRSGSCDEGTERPLLPAYHSQQLQQIASSHQKSFSSGYASQTVGAGGVGQSYHTAMMASQVHPGMTTIHGYPVHHQMMAMNANHPMNSVQQLMNPVNSAATLNSSSQSSTNESPQKPGKNK